MMPPTPELLFPPSDLGSLLTLLELARVSDDPIDDPIPWTWEEWRKGLRSEHAPWQASATIGNSHLFATARLQSRSFVIAYHACGWDIDQRVRFASDLTDHDGELYKGREWLTAWWRWQRYGDLINLDKVINDIFLKSGVIKTSRSISDLEISILCGADHPLHVLARSLFGEETWCSRAERSQHPAVLRWLSHTVAITRWDWQVLHDDAWRRVDRMRHKVYTMCQAVAGPRCTPGDVSAYVVNLGYMVETMDFLRSQGRLEQVRHYRKMMYAIRDCIGSWGRPSTSPLLPPNMCRILATLPSKSYRQMILGDVDKCLKTLKLRAEQAPVFLVDVYDVMSNLDTAFLAGDFGHPNGINADENEHEGLELARRSLPRYW